MRIFDNILQNKGAAMISHEVTQGEHLFTYVLADEQSENLHIYCDEEKDKWINSRDNGVKNADAGLISKLLGPKNNAQA